MKSLTEHNTSYSFYEKVADDMLKKMDVFEPEADLEDEGLWYFVIDRIKTHDDEIFLSFEITLKELEKARKSYQPLINLTQQIVQQLIPDYFKWFEHKFGYFNLEDIIQILSRFFIPKLYNKYLKGENAPDAPIVLREHKSINKLVEKVYNEIKNNLILTDETIELHFPYFNMAQPQIYYDPFHSNVGKFDMYYVLGELKRFIAYHLFQTMGIGKKISFGNYDPMVDPIARKLIKDIYAEAVEKGFVQYDSLDTLGLNESVDWDKIGKVIRDPDKSEQIYTLLVDMFPNAKEVIDYNYYGDNEEPNPNDTFVEMKRFLWDIDKNIIKGPTLELASKFSIENEYKQDLEQHYNDYVEGKLDKFFRESPNDPRDITHDQYENMPPIMVMDGGVIDGNHRAFLAQKAGAKLPTFEIVSAPNTHPNVKKILSIIHPNDKDRDGIPNRLDISQQPTLNETKIRKNQDREYHRNGFINRVVKDILKRVELTLNEIVFDLVSDYGLTIDKPKIIYYYGESGLSRESIEVIKSAVPSMVLWYLSKHDLSAGEEDITTPIISNILSDVIIEKVIEFQEDEDWDDYKETWVLGESKKITFIDKVTQRVIDTIEEDEDHYYFKEISHPSYDTFKGEYGNKFYPLMVRKNGLNNELKSDWLYKKLKNFYGAMYGLREEEMLELYNNILYHILKERRLNSLNPVIIGDWDLEYTPSLQINKEDWESYVDKDYNLRNLEDYIAMINFMGYDRVGDDVELYRNENNISYQDKYTEGWTKEDFKPFHQDLINSLENYHGQKF